MDNESEASSYELQFSIDPSEVIVDQIFIWYLEELKLSNSCFDISIIKILKLNSIQIVDESRKRIQIRLDIYLGEGVLKLSNFCFDISIIKILKLYSIQIVDESRKRIQIRLDQIFIIVFKRRIEIIQLLFWYFHY